MPLAIIQSQRQMLNTFESMGIHSDHLSNGLYLHYRPKMFPSNSVSQTLGIRLSGTWTLTEASCQFWKHLMAPLSKNQQSLWTLLKLLLSLVKGYLSGLMRLHQLETLKQVWKLLKWGLIYLLSTSLEWKSSFLLAQDLRMRKRSQNLQLLFQSLNNSLLQD